MCECGRGGNSRGPRVTNTYRNIDLLLREASKNELDLNRQVAPYLCNFDDRKSIIKINPNVELRTPNEIKEDYLMSYLT